MPIPSTTLKVGNAAPAFTLKTATGTSYALRDFSGKSAVVLIFIRGTW